MKIFFFIQHVFAQCSMPSAKRIHHLYRFSGSCLMLGACHGLDGFLQLLHSNTNALLHFQPLAHQALRAVQTLDFNKIQAYRKFYQLFA